MKEIIVPFEDESIEILRREMKRAHEREEELRRRNSNFIEFLVVRFSGLKIEIFADEHPPPHFRVKSGGDTANFRIDNCEPINGSEVIIRRRREIRKWHKENKQALITKWNESRPSDCPVGKFKEGDGI